MLFHLPTLMLVIGYACFWLELYVLKAPHGVTSPLAVTIFGMITVIVAARAWRRGSVSRKKIGSEIRELYAREKLFFMLAALMGLTLLVIAARAAVLPPHFPQEGDALSYHYPLPRQHLILGNFNFISWATNDLFLLPMQFGLAPFWFVTELPNKIPQFLILLGILAMVGRLCRRLGADIKNVFWALVAVLAMHSVGIQAGTAMLDLAICYLFLASVDSLMAGRWLLMGVEFAFFFWSKPFLPLQVMVIAFLIFAAAALARAGGWRMTLLSELTIEGFKKGLAVNFHRKFALAFTVASVLLAGPFLVKSSLVSGTPLYPFAYGVLEPAAAVSSEMKAALKEAADSHMTGRDQYGYGKDMKEFLTHFWFAAVPEHGVNNRFDYPLGLPYLLLLLPFFWYLFGAIKQRRFEIISFLIVAYWLVWWQGLQQTRHLYIPIMLMLIVVFTRLSVSRVLAVILTLALCFNLLSVVRAHSDWVKSPEDVLHKNDLQIVRMSREYLSAGRKDTVKLDENFSAFAQFPVMVTRKTMPYILGEVK